MSCKDRPARRRLSRKTLITKVHLFRNACVCVLRLEGIEWMHSLPFKAYHIALYVSRKKCNIFASLFVSVRYRQVAASPAAGGNARSRAKDRLFYCVETRQSFAQRKNPLQYNDAFGIHAVRIF